MGLTYTQITSKASRIYSAQGIDSLIVTEAGLREERGASAVVRNVNPSFSSVDKGDGLNEMLSTYDEQICEFFGTIACGIGQNLIITLGASDDHIIVENGLRIEEDYRHYRSAQVLLFDGKYPKQLMMALDSELYSKLDTTIQEFVRKTPDDFDVKTTECVGSAVFVNGTSGYFAHEILGHLLEADSFLNKQMVMRKSGIFFGSQIASEALTLIDTPFDSRHQTNLNRIDDEGVPMDEICLVSQGKVVGCLCTEIIAAEIARPDLSGCARRQSFRFPVLPRMRNTRILPNAHGPSGDELIEQGPTVILQNAINGMVNPFTGDFTINGYGQINEPSHPGILSSVTISGNLLSSLASSVQLGNDFAQQHVQCRKNGQFVSVVVGGPTMRLDGVRIKVQRD